MGYALVYKMSVPELVKAVAVLLLGQGRNWKLATRLGTNAVEVVELDEF